jgi:hypothetical protein
MTDPRIPTRTSEGRARFADAYNELQAHQTGYDDPKTRALVQAYIDDLYAELRRLSPRVKVKREARWDEYPTLEIGELANRFNKKRAGGVAVGVAVGVEAFVALRDKHTPAIEARASACYAEHEGLRRRLSELAPLAEVRPAGPDAYWYALDLRTSWDYSTQGYGAGKYAEGAVQFTADVARSLGFVDGVDLVVLRAPYHTEDAWLAAVRVEDAIDVEIVKRSPPPPLREQVRLAWKRGVNPRVYFSSLPHGYEEQVGIDYFGRDLRVASTAAP